MPHVPLTELVAAAQAGDRLVSFPTDTVPALAVRPDRASLIFAAKRRSETKPLILMGADLADLWEFVAGTPAEKAVWQQIANRYWPGALTLVLPASDRLPVAVNPSNPTTIGIRVPDRAIARHILARTGPLATTSVNRSGDPPLQSLSDINQQFPEVLTLLPSELERVEPDTTVDKPGSPAQSAVGVPSTVVQWTEEGWHILRQGSVLFDPSA
ncbi:L-threonylcarbamoyladenylate synthase [Oculatella sp. LEGE 06141]|uniref:L-threonylcarbamoyladenylate synthase n=1 Tax=Oculatella sp. LEGE 06141 TaxID=1828648 RepID=UPI0018807AAF|nr:L-threonylcarbamoyladenylate synthase [Oculatella sp. LEGE 06141]MBE9180483.1 L-threonylcarbamoyladenylate synthase [Oculatella sp. LEGE 06141]